MTQNDTKYAISLEHLRIALLKRKTVGVWEVEDSCSIEGLDEAQISTAFLPYAKKWQKLTKRISVCLPLDVVDFFPSDAPLGSDDGTKILNEKHGAATHEYVLASRDTKPYGYSIFEIEHVKLAQKFVTKFGFIPTEFGHNQVGLQTSAPQFYPTEKFFVPQLSVAKNEQDQLDFDASEPKSDLAPKKAAPEAPIITARTSPKKYGLFAALFLITLLAAFWIWSSRDGTAPENPIETSEEATTTGETVGETTEPTQSPEQTAEQTTDTTNLDEDITVFSLPPDYVLGVRPGDHAQAVERAEIDQTEIIKSKPEFAIVDRPQTHAAFVEDFLINGPSETPPETTIASPVSRPDDLPQPTSNTEIVLIGISGAAGHPGALIQAADGSYKTVKTGDEIDGWKIEAISKSQVIIRKGNTKETLEVPS